MDNAHDTGAKCPNCGQLQDEFSVVRAVKPDEGFLALVLGGLISSALGVLFVCMHYLQFPLDVLSDNWVGEPQKHTTTYTSLTLGIVLFAAGVLAIGLALWRYRASRVQPRADKAAAYRCDACGFKWSQS